MSLFRKKGGGHILHSMNGILMRDYRDDFITVSFLVGITSVSSDESFPRDLMTETSNRSIFDVQETSISFMNRIGLQKKKNFVSYFAFI